MGHFVSVMTYMQVIQYFLFHQQTPLHLAAEKGRFENTLKYLVDKGAGINIKDNQGVIVILLYYHQKISAAD